MAYARLGGPEWQQIVRGAVAAWREHHERRMKWDAAYRKGYELLGSEYERIFNNCRPMVEGDL